MRLGQRRRLAIGVGAIWALLVGVMWAQGLGDAVDRGPDPQQRPPAGGDGPDAAATAGGPSGIAGQGPAAGAPLALTDEWAMRHRIIELAANEIGSVSASPGPDGFKQGWPRLKLYYEVAFGLRDLETERPQWLAKLKAPNDRIASNGPAHWCGIFGTWAWRTAGMPVSWNTAVSDPGGRRLDYEQFPNHHRFAEKGDIALIKEKPPKAGEEKKPLNHHCLIEWRDGDKVGTIDGNSDNQGILRHTRSIREVASVYSVARVMGLRPTPHQPGGPGSPPGSAGNGSPGTGVGSQLPGAESVLRPPPGALDALAGALDAIFPGAGTAVRSLFE